MRKFSQKYKQSEGYRVESISWSNFLSFPLELDKVPKRILVYKFKCLLSILNKSRVFTRLNACVLSALSDRFQKYKSKT